MSYDDELDMYYDRWLAAKQLAKRLEEGPGGIMEMKQTIADKEAEIERLREALMFYRDAWLVTTEGKIPFEPDDRLWDDKGKVARTALEEKKDD